MSDNARLLDVIRERLAVRLLAQLCPKPRASIALDSIVSPLRSALATAAPPTTVPLLPAWATARAQDCGEADAAALLQKIRWLCSPPDCGARFRALSRHVWSRSPFGISVVSDTGKPGE
jgi:hypothetical protein